MANFMDRMKRCFHCAHWKNSGDPQLRLGDCTFVPPKRPFWSMHERVTTAHTDGTSCTAFEYDKRKPHPLDGCEAVLVALHKGDQISMRTYEEGRQPSIEYAEVIGHGKNHLRVELHNAEYHVRIRASERHRAGTVIGMETWGFNPGEPVMRAGRMLNSLDRAPELLAHVKRGMRVKLLGYPPFDGEARVAFVVSAHKDYLVIRVGNNGRKLILQRTGPMAGIVTNDPLWVLDTRETP